MNGRLTCVVVKFHTDYILHQKLSVQQYKMLRVTGLPSCNPSSCLDSTSCNCVDTVTVHPQY